MRFADLEMRSGNRKVAQGVGEKWFPFVLQLPLEYYSERFRDNASRQAVPHEKLNSFDAAYRGNPTLME